MTKLGTTMCRRSHCCCVDEYAASTGSSKSGFEKFTDDTVAFWCTLVAVVLFLLCCLGGGFYYYHLQKENLGSDYDGGILSVLENCGDCECASCECCERCPSMFKCCPTFVKKKFRGSRSIKYETSYSGVLLIPSCFRGDARSGQLQTMF